MLRVEILSEVPVEVISSSEPEQPEVVEEEEEEKEEDHHPKQEQEEPPKEDEEEDEPAPAAPVQQVVSECFISFSLSLLFCLYHFLSLHLSFFLSLLSSLSLSLPLSPSLSLSFSLVSITNLLQVSMSADSENGDNEYVKVDAEGAEDTQKVRELWNFRFFQNLKFQFLNIDERFDGDFDVNDYWNFRLWTFRN